MPAEPDLYGKSACRALSGYKRNVGLGKENI